MKKSTSLPILLTNPSILIIGGGKVAFHKAKILQKNNIDFFVVAKMVIPKLLKLTKNIKQKSFQRKDIQNHFIIINATGDIKVTNKLLKYKKKHPLLLNIVDNPKHCDFYFMALTKNKPLQIAVTTNGFSPLLAKTFRDKCQNIIPKNINSLVKKKKKERKKEKNG